MAAVSSRSLVSPAAALVLCFSTLLLVAALLPAEVEAYEQEEAMQVQDVAGPTPAYSWCIAQRKASLKMLQVALDWACGPGQADCGPIMPGQPCFLPDNSRGHASYAFNSYYLKNHKAPGSCNFSFLATVVYKDPSYPPCYYPKEL